MSTDSKARAEDVAWMAQTGENATGAAKRLGIRKTALEQWCRNHGMHEEWLTLVSREPCDHNTAAAAMRRYRIGVAA